MTKRYRCVECGRGLNHNADRCYECNKIRTARIKAGFIARFPFVKGIFEAKRTKSKNLNGMTKSQFDGPEVET